MTTTILQVLFNLAPQRLSETVLLAEVRIMRGGGGESEFRSALQRLRTEKHISSEEDALTRDTLWKIEPKGSQRIQGGK